MQYSAPLIVAALLLISFTAGCTDRSSGLPESAGSLNSGDTLVVDVNTMDTVLTSACVQMANQDVTFIDFEIPNSPESDGIILKRFFCLSVDDVPWRIFFFMQ